MSTFATWRRVLRYAWPYRSRLVVAFGAMLVLAATTGLYPVAIEVLTARLFGGAEAAEKVLFPALERGARALERFGLDLDPATFARAVESSLISIFVALVLAKTLSQAARFYAMGSVSQRVIHDLRRDLFGAVVRQSAEFFGAERTGFLISRLINDVGQVGRAATYALPVIVGDGARVAVLATVCLVRYPELSVAAFLVVPLAGLPIWLFGKALKRYARAAQTGIATLTQRASETFSGIRVVHAYEGEARERARFEDEGLRYLRVMLKSARVRAIQTPVMELVGVGALLSTAAWAQRGIEAGTMGGEEVIAFLLALVLLYEPIKAIGRLNGILVPGLVSAERVFAVMDEVPRVRDGQGRPLDKLRSVVRFESVSFRYPGSDLEVLRDLDLELELGKVVALVGASGSGKSTVAALSLRFFDVTKGRISFDGRDVRDASLSSLRAQVALVSQDTFLFDESVRGNVAYGRPGATDLEVDRAIEAAYAKDFVSALPEGSATRVGERGARLSGGQRQRIAIARAFLKDAPLLVLDEATSALDPESEREVQRALDALMENRAVLVITHRLNTVRRAKEIVVLAAGSAVERGTYDELMARAGAFHRLVVAGELG
ncbi:MAG: ATP-binding cassette domain-containing protein [Deltaproteobacteria bacterium]|nr:ATP-binding cassette domain-containing protein [Deltaproteobacteria bacterium]